MPTQTAEARAKGERMSVVISNRNARPKRYTSPFAIPYPKSTPSTEPNAPRSAASRITERAIMARVDPKALSIPSSRVRSSTVIESALKTRNAPTKSAVPAKNSSASLNPCNWPVTSRVLVSLLSACRPSPRAPSSRPRSSPIGTPSAASTAMPETWPGLSKASWTKGSGAIPKATPPNDPPGILSSPTTLASRGPAGVPRVTSSPTFNPAPPPPPPSPAARRPAPPPPRRAGRCAERHLVPDLQPRALRRGAVDGELPPALGEPPVRKLEAGRKLRGLRLDPEEAHALDLRQPFLGLPVEDKGGRHGVPGRRGPDAVQIAHLFYRLLVEPAGPTGRGDGEVGRPVGGGAEPLEGG